MNKVLAYNTISRKRPLVLAFAGLSGHGKTELATSLGYLLGTDMCNVDMSKTRSVTGLFGAAAPYQNHDKVSPLNNYLASHTGERCVVFLDEFDKTTQEVRESLLTILDSGKPPRPVGHLNLSLSKDGELCKFLAENYIQELGARSIQNGIDNLADDLFMDYTVPVDEITEATNSKPHVNYTMSLHSDAHSAEVMIHSIGTTLIPSG
ncbi:unnamed protein product [Aureobasidium mustum]|uniref:ATPase AAA-type core domain-containing protein n=1 Tax=Aureobasidium mustum TaxID=2773714 RepID=A0A9N8JS35_9PEZI|nr:unnamed protein product [Aureobasidium mustum]